MRLSTGSRSATAPVRAAVAVLVSLAVGVGLAPAPASARSVAYGRVVMVDDGDTVDVDIAGDGTAMPKRIRYIGVQAMEMHTYNVNVAKTTGDCWAKEAAVFLYRLAFDKRVRVTSRLESSHKGARLHRSVAVRKSGAWVDTGGRVISAGLALPDNGNIEYLPNADYRLRAQKAAAAHLGMWGDPTHCGAGPSQEVPITVHVLWDAPGNDNANINGEYVEIANAGNVPLPLDGWWVRDNAYRGYKAHGYTFPAGTVVPAGRSIRVHPGVGTNTATDHFWGLAESVFENVTGAPTNMGDGAWLFDPDGDLRAWDMYPCVWACPPPAAEPEPTYTEPPPEL
jgi:endonuclease YncB( thermonuclease family)